MTDDADDFNRSEEPDYRDHEEIKQHELVDGLASFVLLSG